LIAWLKRLSASLFGWITARALYYRSQRVSDAPERPEHDVVYIVGEDGYDWSAVMKCPGGCGKVLEMNLLPDAKPVWRVTEHEDGSVSLHPSVWLKTDELRALALRTRTATRNDSCGAGRAVPNAKLSDPEGVASGRCG